MGKRVRISNDSINSYGTRVLTSGLDISQYEKNPVLLWMHRRGQVIGYMKDLKKENDELTGEPVFDEATELSRTLKKQWEEGSLKMVSIGADVLETSKAAADMAEGQTEATITRSKLYEVSLVDIGANDDAIVLRKDGTDIRLAKDEDTINKNEEDMITKELAVILGLGEDAQEQDILTAAKAMKEENDSAKATAAELSQMRKAEIVRLVGEAEKDGRIEEKDRDVFLSLGEKDGAEALQKVLAAMKPRVKLSSLIASGRTADVKSLHDMSADEIRALRETDKAEYARLYREEYGIELSEY